MRWWKRCSRARPWASRRSSKSRDCPRRPSWRTVRRLHAHRETDMSDWLAGQELEPLPQYLTALAIGLLIGLERERNPTAKAGLRTCALVALAGAISAALAASFDAPSIVAAGAAAVALMMIAAYYERAGEPPEADPGTTTVAAVLVC